MKYFPSPRIIGIFLVISGLVFGVWLWFFKEGSQKEVYIEPQTAQNRVAHPNQDEDKDGLFDWEEVLWKTDPKNPDSDADGINDGEEVRAQKASNQANLTTEENLEYINFTEQVSKALSNTLGPRLLSKKKLDLDDIYRFQELLPSADKILGEVPKITARELNVTEQNDPAAVKSYFNQVYAVYEKTFFGLEKNDLTILQETLIKKDFSYLKKIEEIILAFDQSIKEVKKIPVPKGLENFAVTEINYLMRSKKIVEKFLNTQDDPLTALLMWSLRIRTMEEVRNFHLATSKSLSQQGISFRPDEGGYRFFE